jgi:ribonuclease T2
MKIAQGRIAVLALALLIALAGGAEARRHGHRAQAAGSGQAGNFDYYLLSLSWSPSFCADLGARDGGSECNGPRPYSFVLHGLWPQYTNGWPESCDTGSRPWVPQQTIDDMLDIMPSKKLIIHEYQKHGTCSGLPPERYFDVARKLYTGIKIPERYQRPQETLQVSPGDLVNDFVKANPDLQPEMIAISCDRRLRELRICFSRDLKPQACGGNEAGRKLCSSDRVIMPPVRGGRF